MYESEMEERKHHNKFCTICYEYFLGENLELQYLLDNTNQYIEDESKFHFINYFNRDNNIDIRCFNFHCSDLLHQQEFFERKVLKDEEKFWVDGELKSLMINSSEIVKVYTCFNKKYANYQRCIRESGTEIEAAFSILKEGELGF